MCTYLQSGAFYYKHSRKKWPPPHPHSWSSFEVYLTTIFISVEYFFEHRNNYHFLKFLFRLKKVKNFPEPALLRSFEAIPECGLIPSTLKLVTIEFECTPTSSMNLINVPAYICSLLDGSKNQVVVAKFPVYVTIASFYNTYVFYGIL